MLCRAAFVVCLAFPCAAVAAPATPEEAGRLTALLQTYAGKSEVGAPASVTVTPEGESYRASFDLARMAAALKPFGFDVVATEPYVTMLTPLPDGTWRVTRGPFPQFGFTTKKGLTYSVQLSSASSEAIFDPKLRTFTHGETVIDGNKTSVTMGDKTQHTEMTERGKQTFGARGASPDDVDTTIHQTDADVKYTARSEPAPDSPVANITSTVDAVQTDLSIEHQRNGSLLDLWAFLVAHPSRDLIVADQAELKRRVLAMIPYASAMKLQTALKDFSVATDKGGAKASSFAEGIAYDPSKTDTGLAITLSMKSLAVSVQGGLPDWIVALIPSNLDLSVATSPLDVSQALRILVEGADLAKDDPVPSDVVAKAIAALAPNGGPTYALKPSTLANSTMSIAAFGAFASDGKGKATVEAKGFDEEIAIISKGAVEDPMAAQAVQILSLAKALAVTKPDGRLSWDIETDGGAGGLTVNGKPLQ